ncbi:MAG: ABC transporter substrate-binding protein [Bacteroidota bacterium]|nr:ABC transporter substrate-binding protein [Bacteroidota bacterium]
MKQKKHIVHFIIIFLISLVILGGCSPSDQNKNERNDAIHTLEKVGKDEVSIDFAKGFSVAYKDGYKLVTVHQPWKGAPKPYKYLLLQEGNAVPEHDKDVQVITIPLQSIACLSTTHIPFLEMLGEHEKLTGFATTDYISSPVVRKRIDQGNVRDLGPDGSVNLEVLADISPDALMAFGTGSNTGMFNKVNQMDVPVILNADYLENSALGRAEWIKFTAAFFNKEAQADSIFTSIKNKYDSLKSIGHQVKNKPTVYSGIVYGDIWYVPAGKSWASELLEHAGAAYLWKREGDQGSLELNFEKVYEKASEADFWIGVASFENLEEIKQADIRYTEFKAYKEENVYSYNARMGEKGGNEYMELGYARPDIILADLIKILHPDLLPGHKLYFYKRLPKKAGSPTS